MVLIDARTKGAQMLKIFSALSAAFLRGLCGPKLFTAKFAKKSRKVREENLAIKPAAA